MICPRCNNDKLSIQSASVTAWWIECCYYGCGFNRALSADERAAYIRNIPRGGRTLFPLRAPIAPTPRRVSPA